MTRTRRLAAAYIALAAAVAVLFALNLFWGSVSSARQATCCRLFLQTPLPGHLLWAFPAAQSWRWP